MSDEVVAMPVVQYHPGAILVDTPQYVVNRTNSSRLKIFRLWIRDPTPPPLYYIVMTGGAVAFNISLPTAVKLHQVGFIHTTADPLTRSGDAITWIFGSYPFTTYVQPCYIDAYTGVAGSRYVELGDTYLEPTSNYYFSANSTALDRLWVWMDVECIGESI